MKRRSAEVKQPVLAKVQLRGIDAQEHALGMVAAELVEIARCTHDKKEAQDLVIESLRTFVKSVAKPSPERRGPVKVRSGFMSKRAGQHAGECLSCGDERRLYLRPDESLWCAECTLDDIILTSNIRPASK
jgi:hypothetical protein